MKRSIVGLVVLLLSSLATLGLAQLDPRAEALLNGIERDVAPQPDRLETADITFCMTFYEEEDQPGLCTRVLLDVPNRRMVNETRTEFEDEQEVFKVVYQEGRARVRESFSDGVFELPKTEVESLERTLEELFEQLGDAGAFVPEYERATYDGPVRYGDVIEGVGVTVETTAPSFMLGQPSPQEVTTQFIFDGEGRAIGAVTETPQGRILTVYTNPDDPIPYRRFMNAKAYTLDGEKVTLMSETRVTRYRINEPLDEALFRLELPSTPNSALRVRRFGFTTTTETSRMGGRSASGRRQGDGAIVTWGSRHNFHLRIGATLWYAQRRRDGPPQDARPSGPLRGGDGAPQGRPQQAAGLLRAAWRPRHRGR